ncbi:MAG: hypothetical protein AAF652_01925 [Cyanobacteria bacterium P01_C01_bin.72]
MKLQKSLIAILVSAISLIWANTVVAQEIRTLEDYLEQCIPESEDDELNPECDRLKEAHDAAQEAENAAETEPDQKNNIGGYVGVTLGAFFPDIDESSSVFTRDNKQTRSNRSFPQSKMSQLRPCGVCLEDGSVR